MRFLAQPRRAVDERLLWSRDIRFVRRLAAKIPGSRLLELDTGVVLIGPADVLDVHAANRVAEGRAAGTSRWRALAGKQFRALTAAPPSSNLTPRRVPLC